MGSPNPLPLLPCAGCVVVTNGPVATTRRVCFVCRKPTCASVHGWFNGPRWVCLSCRPFAKPGEQRRLALTLPSTDTPGTEGP